MSGRDKKVKRYWPGKAPEWAVDIDDDNDVIMMERAAAIDKAFPIQKDSEVCRKDDPRADHRRIRQSEIVSTEEDEFDMEEALDDEALDHLDEWRRRVREKLLKREQEEAEALLPVDEKEEEEEEFVYETDLEEEHVGLKPKPVFNKPKSKIEERAVNESTKRRKVETKLFEEVCKDEEIIQKNLKTEANITDVDADDEVNEGDEYEAWKVREIARIKRVRESREAVLKEWQRRNPKPAPPLKQKRRFMQKDYHKGAFFQSDAVGSDQIFHRDFSAPTGEDKMDKTILPEVMQVKHFGRSRRIKWTHLVKEDTTDWNNPWTYDDPLRAKYNAKMAGMNAPIAKPKGSKKLKDWETR